MLRAALLSLAATLAYAASDWPSFRGPNGSGVADLANLPVRFGPSENVIWKTAVPGGQSSPVVAGDRIFVTAFEGEKLLTICLDRKTGKIAWQREAPARPRHQESRREHTDVSQSRNRWRERLRFLRGFRPSSLRHERRRTLAAAARAIQQPIRYGSFAHSRGQRRAAAVRSGHEFVPSSRWTRAMDMCVGRQNVPNAWIRRQ